MGRGVLTFSISSAIAFASYTPTQMGSTVSLPTSLSSTIGMFETGSIISPRIFISTSIKTSKLVPGGAPGVLARQNQRDALASHLSHQAVRKTPRNAHRHVAPSRKLHAVR